MENDSNFNSSITIKLIMFGPETFMLSIIKDLSFIINLRIDSKMKVIY